MSLVFLGFGLACTLFLFLRYAGGPQGPGGGPANPFASDPTMAHPLVEQFASSSVQDLIPMLLLACVMAPIMEETMFRGLLYRHLRDATRGWKLAGLVFSALVVNVIFAAIHPQGVFAIPTLASLACGFVLAREWRGTLIPCIIAHGVNNTLMLSTLICLTR
jgi:membrane protease YdiL (CAAX protease family)